MKVKMKIYILIICSIFIFISCKLNDEKRIKEIQFITSDLSTSSFFIAIDLICDGETFPIVIENNSLYKMLWQRRMIQKQEEFTDKIVNSIINKEPILFDAKDKEILKSYSVIKNDTLNISLNKDKKVFINKYFANNGLKTKEVSFIQEKAIIYYLFNKRIYCKKDCISGNISIVPVTEKPQ